jgi:hypothetical protein
MKYKFLNNEIEVNGNDIIWYGTIANEIRSIITENLRGQGISIESHGIEFTNKCIIKGIKASIKEVKKMYNNKVTELKGKRGINARLCYRG